MNGVNMNDEQQFRDQSRSEILKQSENSKLKKITQEWVEESIKSNYSYHFEWLGRPIIQYPQDIVGTQQLLWNIKPDLIIETGIARGGSLIFYASLLELIAQCGGPADATVLGIDIDIRAHNKEAILAHPMSKRIEMIQGSSIDAEIFQRVRSKAKGKQRVLVCLDSNHTHQHVLEELRLYASLVSVGSYIIVFDTVVEDLPLEAIADRPWSKGNNPKTAVYEYLKTLETKQVYDTEGEPLHFEIDKEIENQLLITVAPSGFLRRLK
jgi:cephalosporin hydroxylase